MASGHVRVPHQQAEHMAAPTSTASTSNNSLANREPSTHGYERLSDPAPGMTALPCQADTSARTTALAAWACATGGTERVPGGGAEAM